MIGESGAGKTTSLRTLDPKTTFIIDADRKGLSWRGWKKQYCAENKNYLRTSNVATIRGMLQRIDTGDLDKFKTIVIDTLNGVMVDDEMRRMNEKGFDKWRDLAASVYGIISGIYDMRDDLTVVCMAHTQTDRDDSGYIFTHMKTSGKKLEKIVPESKFTTVLLAKGSNEKHFFETRSSNSTAKAPLDCFADAEIENDMAMVIETLRKYEEE